MVPFFLPRFRKSHAALLACAVFLPAGLAHAQVTLPTPPGTVVSGSFSIDYTIEGVTFNNVTPASSIDFVVDRKVDFSLDLTTPLTDAIPGQTVTADFQILNWGNDNQAFSVDVIDTDPGFSNSLTGLVTLAYMVDADGNGLFDDAWIPLGEVAATEAVATGAAGTLTSDIAPGAAVRLRAQISVPPTATVPSDYRFAVQLLARQPRAWRLEAGAAEGALMSPDNDGQNTLLGAAENLFADGALPTAPATGLLDGEHDAILASVQALPVVSDGVVLTKTVSVIASAVSANCATTTGWQGALAVNGACIEYLISVSNQNANAFADSIVVRDVLPAGLIFEGATSTGFSPSTSVNAPVLDQPAATTVCDGTPATCVIELSGAGLPVGGNGDVRIRARIQ